MPDSDSVRSWLSVVRAYNLCEAVMARRLGELGVRTQEHEILANLRRDPGTGEHAREAACGKASVLFR